MSGQASSAPGVRGRILLLRSGEGTGDASSALAVSGFEVVTAYSTDLHWTKMVSGSRWAAIVVESAALDEIAVELAAEIEEIPPNERPLIIVSGAGGEKSWNLPTPLRGALFLAGSEDIASCIQDGEIL